MGGTASRKQLVCVKRFRRTATHNAAVARPELVLERQGNHLLARRGTALQRLRVLNLYHDNLEGVEMDSTITVLTRLEEIALGDVEHVD